MYSSASRSIATLVSVPVSALVWPMALPSRARAIVPAMKALRMVCRPFHCLDVQTVQLIPQQRILPSAQDTGVVEL